MSRNENPQQRPTRARFATTHWSVVLAAGDRADVHYEDALQTLSVRPIGIPSTPMSGSAAMALKMPKT